jgi:hypothetical protein
MQKSTTRTSLPSSKAFCIGTLKQLISDLKFRETEPLLVWIWITRNKNWVCHLIFMQMSTMIYSSRDVMAHQDLTSSLWFSKLIYASQWRYERATQSNSYTIVPNILKNACWATISISYSYFDDLAQAVQWFLYSRRPSGRAPSWSRSSKKIIISTVFVIPNNCARLPNCACSK